MRERLTKKRAHDSQDLSESDTIKKMQTPGPGVSPPPPQGLDPGTCHLKVLIPSAAAGAIIGKGGETIDYSFIRIRTKGRQLRIKKAVEADTVTNETEKIMLGGVLNHRVVDVGACITGK